MQPKQVNVLGDGSIVVVASVYKATPPDSSLIFKLTPSGTLDTTFAPGGTALNVNIQSFAVQPDGALVFGGQAREDQHLSPFVGRLTGAGALDITFARSGMHVFDGYGGPGISALFLSPGAMKIWSFTQYRFVKKRGGGYDRSVRTRQRFAVVAL